MKKVLRALERTALGRALVWAVAIVAIMTSLVILKVRGHKLED